MKTTEKGGKREMRTTPHDEKLIKKLGTKLGYGFSDLVRYALRKLAESEKA